MPPIIRWYVKTALLYLAVALGWGILLETGTPRATLTPTYWHLFLVGWLTQLIFGIALWMLPTYAHGRPRGDEHINWAVYVLLNIGLLLRALAEPLRVAQIGEAALWGGTLVASAILQWLAALGFVINAWPRVRGPRRKQSGGR